MPTSGCGKLMWYAVQVSQSVVVGVVCLKSWVW